MVIDEAAWIPDVDALWMAVVPTISTRTEYRLSVVSTPGLRAGMFYRLWNNGDDAWSPHRVSIYDAKAGGVPHDIGAPWAAVADEVTWRAAYECQFVDESHALLPYDLHTPIYVVIAAWMNIQNIATDQMTNPKALSLNTKPNIRGRRRNIAPPK